MSYALAQRRPKQLRNGARVGATYRSQAELTTAESISQLRWVLTERANERGPRS